MPSQSQKRKKRREIRLLQSEASWLQKALFALGKIQDVREKLADLRGGEIEPLTFTIGGKEISVDEFEEVLGEQVRDHLEHVRESRKKLRFGG